MGGGVRGGEREGGTRTGDQSSAVLSILPKTVQG